MSNNSKVLIAAAAGLATGAILGILFAPDKGEDTRKEINKQLKKLADNVETGYNKTRGKFNDLKEKVESALSEKVEQFS